MRHDFLAVLGCSLLLSVAHAEDTGVKRHAYETDKMAQQIQSANTQAEMEKFRQELEATRELVEKLNRKVEEQNQTILELKQSRSILDENIPASGEGRPMTAAEAEEFRRRLDELSEASKKTSVSDFNPGIGFVGDTIFGYRSKGSDQTDGERPGGADVFFRAAELTLEASVDPFAKGYAIIAGGDDGTGEAVVGVEEAAIVTTSLPWNLTARGGRFFAEIGRMAHWHPHAYPFVQPPLAIEEYVGGESRTDGLELSYLFPTDHYINLTVGGGTQIGEDMNDPGVKRSWNELNYWARLSSYFDITDNLNLETGLTGLINDRTFGRGDLPERRRQLGVLDLTLRYQPLASTVYQGLEWGTELFSNSADFDLDTGRTEEDAFGLYSYVAAKLNKNWTTGFHFDFAQANVDSDLETFRYSPFVTWNVSEFQYLRLQYSYTDRNDVFRQNASLKDEHAVFLQWSFVLGHHTHGFRQR